MTVLDLCNRCKQLNETEIASLHTVLALGTFDGVHAGHAALLRQAVSAAENLTKKNSINVDPAVWTFSDSPDRKSAHLTTLPDKLSLLASMGIRYVFLYDFASVRTVPADVFAERILLNTCGARAAVCGFNFRFGHMAAGTPKLLSEILASHNADTYIVNAVMLGGAPISSTRIRTLLTEGDVPAAAHCLGRWFSFSLPVVHGKELGRTIGVPTINQNIPEKLLTPCPGTYATAVSVDGILYPGVTNIGIRPSIRENDTHIPNAETHIIGYHGWLYDKSVRVYFRFRLRDERQFGTLEALKEQIAHDVDVSASAFDQNTKELCHV